MWLGQSVRGIPVLSSLITLLVRILSTNLNIVILKAISSNLRYINSNQTSQTTKYYISFHALKRHNSIKSIGTTDWGVFSPFPKKVGKDLFMLFYFKFLKKFISNFLILKIYRILSGKII